MRAWSMCRRVFRWRSSALLGVLVFGLTAVWPSDASARILAKGQLVESIISNCLRDDTTTDLGVPACSLLYDEDPGCDFGPTGRGRWQLRWTAGTGVSVKVRLTGLDAACEGQELRVLAFFSGIAEACSGALCATNYAVDPWSAGASCIVQSGACAINARIAGTAGLALSLRQPGDIGLIRYDAQAGGLRSFVSGIEQ